MPGLETTLQFQNKDLSMTNSVNMIGLKINSNDLDKAQLIEDSIRTHELKAYMLSMENYILYFINEIHVPNELLNDNGQLQLNDLLFHNVTNEITNLSAETPIFRVN